MIAYEDIGLANPAVAARTVTAIQAALQLGFPEARIPLANAVIELALSPKSNAAITAVDAAISDVRKGATGDVPAHLKDSHYSGAKQLGHGVDYVYPHGHPGDWVPQQYLPDKLMGSSYFKPAGNSKVERAYKEQYAKLRKAQHDGLKGK